VAKSCGAVLLTVATLWSVQSPAQTASPASDATLSDTEFSKDSENPVTRQITLPQRYEADFRNGEDEATKHQFQINQAVVPFSLSEDWALITRTKLPVIVQPPRKRGEQWATGLGNGYTTFFLSPAYGGSFYWGAGPLLYYPATNFVRRRHRVGLRPVGGLSQEGRRPLGAWCRHQQHLVVWRSTHQQQNQQHAAQSDCQLSFRRRMGCRVVAEHHQQLDRKRSEMDRPRRRQLQQNGRARRAAEKFALESYYNAIRPVSGNDTWLLQFTVTFVFPG
jgi:hypothetical protein